MTAKEAKFNFEFFLLMLSVGRTDEAHKAAVEVLSYFTAATLEQLKAERQALLDERIATAGHGKRARIQVQIDALDQEILGLSAEKETSNVAG